ncbi:U-box domain-containing protein 5 [Prunus yedoensis var. nudiflora]|uniref:RING-type E3 ubiquitin transferase n=1 Tax=Prunus yedoensis var. nudiflora TaxID=2094558 RepID=A0A314YUL8_PRUYE|nr:U-box domain-containing protein 5 [Prunus yedoensis var. nudiflora]
MGTDAAEGVETMRKPHSFKVHRLMCTELMKLVDRISRIFPDIEAARPRCTTGIQALCLLTRAIEKAKLLLQHCSDSSKLYLAFTGDAIVSRCQRSSNLLEQNLHEIQNWVPVMLVAEISQIVDDLKGATFILDPSEEEAGRVVRGLLHQDASQSNSREDSEIKALQIASWRLHITSSKAMLIEKRSIKKLLDKVGDSDLRKKQILTYFLCLIKKYGHLITGKQAEGALLRQQGSLASETSSNGLEYNQYAEAEPHVKYNQYNRSDMLHRTVPPEEFLCGISSRLMYDPVVIASGQTYEKKWIQKWFDEGHDTCPKTHMKLSHLSFTPNVAMKELISRWCTEYGVTIPDPSMQPETLSWETSSTSIASLGSSMNDIHLQMDLSNVSFGSLDTSYNSDSSRTKIESGLSLVQEYDDSLKYQYAKNCETDSEFLSKLGELPWESQCKVVEDVKSHLKCNRQASYSMSSKNFVEPLIKFLRDAHDLDDVKAQREGFKLLFTFVSKNRNDITYLREEAYTLLASYLDSEVIRKFLPYWKLCLSNSIADDALVGNCISILKNLCDTEEARISIAETSGCIASIAEILETGSSEDQEHAVAILLSLCSQRVEFCHLVMHEGVIPPLVFLSNNGKERAMISALEVLRLLRDIDYVDEQECSGSDLDASKDNDNHSAGKKLPKTSGFFGRTMFKFSKPSSLAPKKKK